MFTGSGFEVWGVVGRIEGLACGVSCLGMECRVLGLGIRIEGLGFRVSDLQFSGRGLESRV